MRYDFLGRRRSRRTPALLILVAVIIAASYALAWFVVPGEPKDGNFVVAPGSSVERIIAGLEKAGVVRSTLVFKAALRTSGLATKLQPGTYDLRGAGSYSEVIERLASGGVSAEEFTLRVIEGDDLRDIAAALEKAGYARADELFQVTGLPATDHRTLSAAAAPQPDDFSREYQFLKDKPSYVNLEGFLFPDTYRVFHTATPEEIVKKMLANFDRKFTTEMRVQAAAQGHSIFDVVRLASMVELEVHGDEDRRMVADLFWRRLGEGMGLQADSTVNYITGGKKPSVTLEETKNVSPYNTYKYRGLPLGPIGNPGISALKAVLNPKPNAYVYFLTDPEGKVHYARTFEEHNRNRVNYLR